MWTRSPASLVTSGFCCFLRCPETPRLGKLESRESSTSKITAPKGGRGQGRVRAHWTLPVFGHGSGWQGSDCGVQVFRVLLNGTCACSRKTRYYLNLTGQARAVFMFLGSAPATCCGPPHVGCPGSRCVGSQSLLFESDGAWTDRDLNDTGSGEAKPRAKKGCAHALAT